MGMRKSSKKNIPKGKKPKKKSDFFEDLFTPSFADCLVEEKIGEDIRHLKEMISELPKIDNDVVTQTFKLSAEIYSETGNECLHSCLKTYATFAMEIYGIDLVTMIPKKIVFKAPEKTVDVEEEINPRIRSNFGEKIIFWGVILIIGVLLVVGITFIFEHDFEKEELGEVSLVKNDTIIVEPQYETITTPDIISFGTVLAAADSNNYKTVTIVGYLIKRADGEGEFATYSNCAVDDFGTCIVLRKLSEQQYALFEKEQSDEIYNITGIFKKGSEDHYIDIISIKAIPHPVVVTRQIIR